MLLLNKVYMKIHGGKTTYFFVESKNYNFNIKKVYDKEFHPIIIDKELFEQACNLIKRNILTAETFSQCDGYDIALGTPVSTKIGDD